MLGPHGEGNAITASAAAAAERPRAATTPARGLSYAKLIQTSFAAPQSARQAANAIALAASIGLRESDLRMRRISSPSTLQVDDGVRDVRPDRRVAGVP